MIKLTTIAIIWSIPLNKMIPIKSWERVNKFYFNINNESN